MLREEWESIVSRLNTRQDVTKLACESDGRYGIETLLAIYLQKNVLHMIANTYQVTQKAEQIISRYECGESIVNIAKNINLAPCTVARKIMEIAYGYKKQHIATLLRKPSQIEDERLTREVEACVASDEHSGPRMDRYRAVLGIEYEHLLQEKLNNLRLEYETENDLRARRTASTPDVLLRVPVGISNKVVTWIDSKAKFGDIFFLKKDYKESISSYVQSFGPGMVIYWFGFVTDCDAPILADTNVLVVDSFPKHVYTLPGSTLPLPESDTSAPAD